MWSATEFSRTRGNIEENLQIKNFLQLIKVKVSAEANLTRDLFLHSESRALH